jgi:hypothetical protein
MGITGIEDKHIILGRFDLITLWKLTNSKTAHQKRYKTFNGKRNCKTKKTLTEGVCKP